MSKTPRTDALAGDSYGGPIFDLARELEARAQKAAEEMRERIAVYAEGWVHDEYWPPTIAELIRALPIEAEK